MLGMGNSGNAGAEEGAEQGGEDEFFHGCLLVDNK
jgi:hypothetical protein